MTERIAVSLPKALIERIEKVRRQLKVNRSKFFLFALSRYLDAVVEDKDEKLAKTYKEIKETDKELLAHFSQGMKNLPPYEQG